MLLCILYIIEAASFYWLLYKNTNDILNPFAITLGSWLGAAGISQLNIGGILPDWELMTHITVQAFALTVFLIGSRRNKSSGEYYYSNLTIKFNNKFIIASRVVFLVSFICALIEWKSNGFVITIFNSSTADLKGDMIALSGIHYGTVCLPYCALVSLYEIYFRKNKKKSTWIYNISVIASCVFYSLFIELSRGSMLIIILGGILLTHSRFRIKFSKLVRYALMLTLLMVILMMIRIQNRDSFIYTATGTYEWWSPIYLYVATCFDNLNTLIKSGTPMTLCYATVLKPILDVFNIDLNIPIIEYNYSFFNARTMIYSFYHDLGIIGVVIYSFIIYMVVSRIYRRAKYDSRYLLLLAALQKSIYMVFFGNYFTGVFCPSFPFIVIWFLGIISQTNIVIGRYGRTKSVKYLQK